MNRYELVSDRLALLQDSSNPFWLFLEPWIAVITREAHALGVPACIFFAGCWILVVEWNFVISKLLLLPCQINVHAVYIQCIISISFVCRRSIKYKNSGAIQMCVLEDCNRGLELLKQLGEVPPSVEPFPWVYYLASFD